MTDVWSSLGLGGPTPLERMSAYGRRQAEINRRAIAENRFPVPGEDPELDSMRQDIAGMFDFTSPLQWGSLGLGGYPMMAAIFAGKGAKTADLGKLAEAKRLTQVGEDARSIWGKTGWFKSPDGEWRFEIDDSGMRLRETLDDNVANKMPMDSWWRHDDLFSAYPEIRDTTWMPSDQMRPGSGAYQPRTNEITYGVGGYGRRDTPASVTTHELQHRVQQIEDFARGTQPERAAEPFVTAINKEMSDLVRAKDRASDPRVKQELMDQYLSLMEKRSSVVADRMALYNRYAGEAEARAAMDRWDFSPAERAANFPLDSYDVPLDELIVRR